MVQPANRRPLLESDKGAANGVASLGADGKILPTQITRGSGVSIDTDGVPYLDSAGVGFILPDEDGRPYIEI